eukprot:TRINITY_DN6754_c0_g1_i2.p1 TRINITY_DN6754_c0_g1~~TRINITY_DN6754_c0_g1_i2.p1  ORF type:complete len:167 (-),score=2.11 TRINITY_DN6754_c0_g1_i2:192-692(-)
MQRGLVGSEMCIRDRSQYIQMEQRTNHRSEWKAIKFFRIIIKGYTNCSYLIAQPVVMIPSSIVSIVSCFLLFGIFGHSLITNERSHIILCGFISAAIQGMAQGLALADYLKKRQPHWSLVVLFLGSMLGILYAVGSNLMLGRTNNYLLKVAFLINLSLLYYPCTLR